MFRTSQISLHVRVWFCLIHSAGVDFALSIGGAPQNPAKPCSPLGAHKVRNGLYEPFQGGTQSSSLQLCKEPTAVHEATCGF